MCQCTPTKRTPVCDKCPDDLKASWGIKPASPSPDEALRVALDSLRESTIANHASSLELAGIVRKQLVEIRDLHDLVTHLVRQNGEMKDRVEALETAVALGAKRGAA